MIGVAEGSQTGLMESRRHSEQEVCYWSYRRHAISGVRVHRGINQMVHGSLHGARIESEGKSRGMLCVCKEMEGYRSVHKSLVQPYIHTIEGRKETANPTIKLEIQQCLSASSKCKLLQI